MGYIDDILNNAESIVEKYRTGNTCFSIPISAVETSDTRIIEVYGDLFIGYLKKMGIVAYVKINYNYSEFYIFEVNNLKKKITVEIPYENRKVYVDFVEEINKLVDEDGLVLVAVNNNPYVLKGYFIIETNTNFESIKQAILDKGLKICNDIGSDEVFKDIAKRQYNSSNISQDADSEKILNLFNQLFIYMEKADEWSEGSKKKKIFISYSHKDKEIVHRVENEMRTYGLNTWIDANDMDFGSNIRDSVYSAIDECDMYLVFLSSNTKDSNFAGFELSIFFDSIINKKIITKKWMLIKLDEVDLNEIAKGLGGYLYYDFSNNRDYEELVKEISKKLNKL